MLDIQSAAADLDEEKRKKIERKKTRKKR